MSDNPGRPFSELRDTGLLWLINASVLHPRGYALALHYDDVTAEPTGWSLLGDGNEVWTFGDGPEMDDALRRVKELLP